jgi:hypothetical protein
VSKVVSLSKATNDARFTTKEQLLGEVYELLMAEGSEVQRANKMIIVTLDTTDDKFAVNFWNSGMRSSEIVALAAVLQSLAQNYLGYVANVSDVIPGTLPGGE